MKKNLLLYILVAFLLVVNGFFLVKYFGGDSGRKPKNPGIFIAKELNFTDEQMQAFNRINDAHHKEMRAHGRSMKELKDALFRRIGNSNIAKREIDSITQLIGKKEQEKDLKTFYHFQEVLKICDEAQKEKFTKILTDALHTHGKKEPPGKRP